MTGGAVSGRSDRRSEYRRKRPGSFVRRRRTTRSPAAGTGGATKSRLPETLAVLQVRNFRLVLAGQAVSVLGDRKVAVAFALWGPLAAVIGVSAVLWIAFALMGLLAAVLLALPDTRHVQWSNDDSAVPAVRLSVDPEAG